MQLFPAKEEERVERTSPGFVGAENNRPGTIRASGYGFGVYSGLVETRYREGVLPRCMKASKPFTDEEPLLWMLNIAPTPKRRQLLNDSFLRVSST